MLRLVLLVTSANDGSSLCSPSEAPFLWVWLWFSGYLRFSLGLANMLVRLLSIAAKHVELECMSGRACLHDLHFAACVLLMIKFRYLSSRHSNSERERRGKREIRCVPA